MEYPKNSIYHHFALSLVILSLFGCSSIAIESKKTSNEVLSINENFKIEGKFKLSYMDSKETGYFVLSKEGNTVSLNIGKNYLLPEKVIILDRRETLNINEFIEKIQTSIDLIDFKNQEKLTEELNDLILDNINELEKIFQHRGFLSNL